MQFITRIRIFAISASILAVAVPAVAASPASAAGTPGVHAAKHHKKKKHKKKKHHHSSSHPPANTTPPGSGPVGGSNPAASPGPTASPTPTPTAATFPLGTYACNQVVQDINTGTYSNYFRTNITFFSDGTYVKFGSVRGPGWNQQGNTINFTGGPFSDTYDQDVGTWDPQGVSMPHANPDPGPVFTLVMSSTRQPSGDLMPVTEFTGSVPESFYYCKLQ